jgi:hypothetical protein
VDPGTETVATLAAKAPSEELIVVAKSLDRDLSADPR